MTARKNVCSAERPTETNLNQRYFYPIAVAYRKK